MVNEYKEKLEQANHIIDLLIDIVAANENGPQTWEFFSCHVGPDCACCTQQDRITCWNSFFERNYDEEVSNG